MNAPRVPGRVLAWTALLVALGASVAANVAYARPGAGPRLSSGVAPLLVVLAAGLLERVPLAGIVWWRRWLAYGGLGLVVTAAFITSFDHQYALLVSYGNAKLSAALLPIAVDGLIILASVCLTVIAERRRQADRTTAVTAVVAPTEVRFASGAEVRAEGSAPKGVDTTDVPAAEVREPVPATSVPQVRAKRDRTSARRTAAETRQLAAEVRAANPGATQAEVAALLGISATRLRQVEGAAVPAERVNGARVLTTPTAAEPAP